MKTAWVFPGQGAQSIGMGRTLYEQSARAKSVFERADEALGEKLSKLIFEGPEDQLVLTENLQPAILTVSIASLEAIRERFPTLPSPAFGAGHSLGEYSAYVAASAISLEDAVRLVRARGRAMQSAVPAGVGAMAAIMGLDPAIVEEICKEVRAEGETVSPANFNAPGQIVIAGTSAGVDRARTFVGDRKGKAIPLKVSAPFHCSLMAPAALVVEAELEKIAVHEAAFPIVANVDATPVTAPSEIKKRLVAQVAGAVQWQACVERMAAETVTRVIEIGPGKVLSGLIRRISKDVESHNIGEMAALEGLEAFLGETFVRAPSTSTMPPPMV